MAAKNKSGRSILPSTHSRTLRWALAIMLFGLCVVASMGQTGIQDLNFEAQSEFQPTIKDAVKFSDLPEIRDSVKRLTNLTYPMAGTPLFPKTEVQTIEAAKMKDEPLPKLYHALLKVGYNPIYNMPYGEIWAGSTRSRNGNYGAHFRHLSSGSTLENTGYSGFSENGFDVNGKKFYRKHTLGGTLNWQQQGVHYYGYNKDLNNVTRDFTRQRYQLIEPRVMLTSHHTDSARVNNRIELGFYNLRNLHREAENNIRFDGTGNLFINREKLNLALLADYYNHRQANDTLNNLILTFSPSFEARGKRWQANVGIAATLDHWDNSDKFYFYPKIDVYYDVYERLVIPYAGATGGLVKNSFRKFWSENPFVDTTLNYQNTNRKYDLFGGLRGNLSSNTSYDARVSFAQADQLHFYAVDFSGNQLNNAFDVIYDNATILTISGELKYQLREKVAVAARGSYYSYTTKNITRALHRPDYDVTVSASYNLRSKFIVRAELYMMGNQWTRRPSGDVFTPYQIPGWIDINLEAEYRYSKMLGFFARFTNIGNQRYFRWDRYPVQRLGAMVGLSFVPF